MSRARTAVPLFILAVACVACSGGSLTNPSDDGNGTSSGISSDADLHRFVTSSQPFQTYTPFPNLIASPTGTLLASSAHQPVIRVSLNAVAAGSLRDGKLPDGAAFPDGSVIFKEVLGAGGVVSVYAVMYKDRQNSLAGNGWLWGELRPNGEPEYSVKNRGNACTSCHALDRGAQNDSVRIFERQR